VGECVGHEKGNLEPDSTLARDFDPALFCSYYMGQVGFVALFLPFLVFNYELFLLGSHICGLG